MAKKKNNLIEPFIVHYYIDGNELKVIYSDSKTFSFDYSKEKELEILKTMREQVKDIDKLRKELTKEKNLDTGLLLLSSSFVLFNGLLMTTSIPDLRPINIVAVLAGSLGSIYFGINAFKEDDELRTIEKYKFFIENEKIITDEMVSQYYEIYGSDAPIEEANTITINDLNDYSLEDLEEMVSMIKEKNELQLKKA